MYWSRAVAAPAGSFCVAAATTASRSCGQEQKFGDMGFSRTIETKNEVCPGWELAVDRVTGEGYKWSSVTSHIPELLPGLCVKRLGSRTASTSVRRCFESSSVAVKTVRKEKADGLGKGNVGMRPATIFIAPPSTKLPPHAV